MLKKLKIALLILILAEEIRSAMSTMKINYCDICKDKKFDYELLQDTNLKICNNCAAHFNDIGSGI